MSENLKVVLIGVYPPPYGGVSIHIQRLRDLCLTGGMKCTVIDISRSVKKTPDVVNITRIWKWLRILASRQDIVHLHTSSFNWAIPVVFFYLFRIKGARCVLSFHSLVQDPQDFGFLGRRIMRNVLNSISHCVAVNAGIRDKLVALGAWPETISVIPAYLAPMIKEEEIAEVPQETWDFMAGHSPVISANAFAIRKYQGQDLYGIDMCVELCAALKKDYPQVGVVFYLPSIGDRAAFHELQRRISEKGIGDNFLFQTRPCQFYPVLMKSDIFVRPTNTDGDAVSLREALYFQKPSVASDAAPRPEGTVIFRSRDVADFTKCVKTVWENYAAYRAKLDSRETPDAMNDILDIYRRVAGKESGLSLK
jgi:glycosyltransferase involved in cell wall biosynthesis